MKRTMHLYESCTHVYTVHAVEWLQILSDSAPDEACVFNQDQPVLTACRMYETFFRSLSVSQYNQHTFSLALCQEMGCMWR